MSEFRRNALMPAVALAAALVPFAIAILCGLDAPSAARAGLFVAGLMTAAVAYWKPHWFWEHPEVEALRYFLGHRATTWIYYLISAVLMYLSLMVPGQ